MQLPYKYDDLLKDADGLETKNIALQQMNMVDIDMTNSMMDRYEGPYYMTVSESLTEEISNNLTMEDNSEIFHTTYFDKESDVMDEFEDLDVHDSLFRFTLPFRFGKLPNDEEMYKKVFIKTSHDCMWAGHCGSMEHKDDCDKLNCPMTMHKPGHVIPPLPSVPVPIPPQVQPVQQSLLKPNLKNAGIPVINMITPHTPPMSDDEKDQQKKKVARLSGAASDIDEVDRELHEYFGSDLDKLDQEGEDSEGSASSEESSSEYEKPNHAGPSTDIQNIYTLSRNLRATVNDHSYHKDKNASMIMSDLGIDTPSDSGGSTPPRCDSVKSFLDEEIDVVSVSDKKYPVGTRMGYIPPTNPPNGARRIVQRCTETAMTNGARNNKNGVKVMLPTKRSSPTTNYSPAKRRVSAPTNENKGRRPRQTRATNSTNGRRRSNNGNDSEGSENDHLPSEKRNLHNDMERQRRVDLRRAFEDLRKLVPEVMRKERAAKVVILREAAKYCNNLTRTSLNFQQHKVDLENHQEKLLWKLSNLRRKAAMEMGVVFEEENYDDEEE